MIVRDKRGDRVQIVVPGEGLTSVVHYTAIVIWHAGIVDVVGVFLKCYAGFDQNIRIYLEELTLRVLIDVFPSYIDELVSIWKFSIKKIRDSFTMEFLPGRLCSC